jgi:acyl-CoA reductase-like NAD-dependent aldehyde dehydrogenase
LKKVVLELGGSDPFIVLDDAEIEIAAKNAALGRTVNSGQSCIAAKRFIVVKKVASAFIEKFVDCMNNRVVGDPSDDKTEVGPLVNENAVKTIEKQVAAAVKEGARVVCGGVRLKRKGYYFDPTVLVGVTRNMAIAQEEIFGPVALVMVVDDEDEAVAVANSTEFGLGASVWTKDVKRGERVARQLEAGTVFVNSIVKSDPRMPFGGVKESGIGRELSHYGLKEFVNVKGLNVYEMK